VFSALALTFIVMVLFMDLFFLGIFCGFVKNVGRGLKFEIKSDK
jgi:hypothetical protein